MGKREQEQCRRYRGDLQRSRAQMEEFLDNGYDALSRYDIEAAASGDVEKALWTALYLVGNQVRYFTEREEECDGIPRQATLFEASRRR
jgi:hypothetical protein